MVAKGTLTWLFASNLLILIVIYSQLLSIGYCKSKKDESADEKWKKKDVTDYTDADLERLYEQWEVC